MQPAAPAAARTALLAQSLAVTPVMASPGEITETANAACVVNAAPVTSASSGTPSPSRTPAFTRSAYAVFASRFAAGDIVNVRLSDVAGCADMATQVAKPSDE